MPRCAALLCVSLVLCVALSQCFGLSLLTKEKRGWTLNSAGYLLGPHAVDNHPSFNEKRGLAGKRELHLEDEINSDNVLQALTDENAIRIVIEFLTYLRLKETGALDNMPIPFSSDVQP
uniref:Galanin peptides n=1 Tax=Callorhinchus milii TaxID=7868 RepID=K4FT90_CALMI|nr:galanin peptide [Callorhinchus milii]|eukprot:gi/632940942/ref/XP_007885602.1/ PREDICTED: galanin peptides [Callorhinchus milii]